MSTVSPSVESKEPAFKSYENSQLQVDAHIKQAVESYTGELPKSLQTVDVTERSKIIASKFSFGDLLEINFAMQGMFDLPEQSKKIQNVVARILKKMLEEEKPKTTIQTVVPIASVGPAAIDINAAQEAKTPATSPTTSTAAATIQDLELAQVTEPAPKKEEEIVPKRLIEIIKNILFNYPQFANMLIEILGKLITVGNEVNAKAGEIFSRVQETVLTYFMSDKKGQPGQPAEQQPVAQDNCTVTPGP